MAVRKNIKVIPSAGGPPPRRPRTATTARPEVPIGGVILWGVTLPASGTEPVPGWLGCNGQAVARAGKYAALFQVIGTAYGVGNGTTTFNVPDMRQRFPLGLAASGTGSTLGGTGGAIDHQHGSPVTSGAPSATLANIAVTGAEAAGSATHTHDVEIAAQNPPFQVFTYIIRAR